MYPTQDYDFKHSAVDHLTCVGSNLIYNEIEAGGSWLSKKLKTGLITWELDSVPVYAALSHFTPSFCRSRSHRSSRRHYSRSHSRSHSRRRRSRSRSNSSEYHRRHSHSPMSNRRRHIGDRVRHWVCSIHDALCSAVLRSVTFSSPLDKPRPKLLPGSVWPEPVHHRERPERGLLQVWPSEWRQHCVWPAVSTLQGFLLCLLREQRRCERGEFFRLNSNVQFSCKIWLVQLQLSFVGISKK